MEVNNSELTSGQCPGAYKDMTFYIPGDSRTLKMVDWFSSSQEKLISGNKTTVQVWQSDANLVPNCTNASQWKRLSDYSPGANERVYALL